MRPRALIFDFNGTLSDDEPIMCEIFQELFAAAGKPLTEEEYFDGLAGRSDPEIVERWLGAADQNIIATKIDRYRARGGRVERARARARGRAGRSRLCRLPSSPEPPGTRSSRC